MPLAFALPPGRVDLDVALRTDAAAKGRGGFDPPDHGLPTTKSYASSRVLTPASAKVAISR